MTTPLALPDVPRASFLDKSGRITPIWQRFFRDLVERVGGSNQLSNTEIVAVIASTSLVASRLMATSALSEYISVDDLTAWILGTADQITATNAAGGKVTLSLPGSISLTGAAAARILATDASKKTVSADLASWIAAGAGISVADDGDGSVTITNTGTGKLVGFASTQTGTVATGTTVMPFDNTIPQNTEGDQYMTLAYTPASATNILRINISALLSVGANVQICGALFQDTTAGALAAARVGMSAYATGDMMGITHHMVAGTTSATTFKFRAGPAAAGTVTFNGSAAGQIFGGVSASSISITETTP